MNIPNLTIRSNQSPYSQLSSLTFKQSSPSGAILPVLADEISDEVSFRVYNNYALASSIASALNVRITTWDGSSASSHTAAKSVVANQWIRISEYGFGESSGTPGLFTYWTDNKTAIGGNNAYSPQKGSNGGLSPMIRAGSDGNGCGFIEFKSSAHLPPDAQAGTQTFALSIEFDWLP